MLHRRKKPFRPTAQVQAIRILALVLFVLICSFVVRDLHNEELAAIILDSNSVDEVKMSSLTIAVALCTTSKGIQPLTFDHLALTKILLPSISKTLEEPYLYEFHIGVDDDDHFYTDSFNQRDVIKRTTPHPLQFYVFPSTKNRVPFNELLAEVYKSGADYIVRVNDDTEFITTGWTSLGVHVLLNNRPVNSGVVGPFVRGPANVKNTILTHDMVHRTHLETFPHYYSPAFDNQWLDDWITRVYSPGHVNWIDDWVVHHHSDHHGTRYTAWSGKLKLLEPEVEKGLDTFNGWLWREHEEAKLWTVVLTVSDGFDDMFRNWHYWFRKLELQLEVVVIAKDYTTFLRYQKLGGVLTFLSPNVSGLNNSVAFTYDSKQYNRLVSTRAADLLYVLQYRSKVIYTDIDTVWLKDPTSFLRGDFDIAGGLDAWKFDKPYYCTGFLALKNTIATQKLLKLWDDVMTERPQLNQPIFNDILHGKDSDVRHSPLSRVHFPSGNLYFDFQQRQHTVVVHNNFMQGAHEKIKRFKSNGLWYDQDKHMKNQGQD
jgi:hypothetical protein